MLSWPCQDAVLAEVEAEAEVAAPSGVEEVPSLDEGESAAAKEVRQPQSCTPSTAAAKGKDKDRVGQEKGGGRGKGNGGRGKEGRGEGMGGVKGGEGRVGGRGRGGCGCEVWRKWSRSARKGPDRPCKGPDQPRKGPISPPIFSENLGLQPPFFSVQTHTN